MDHTRRATPGLSSKRPWERGQPIMSREKENNNCCVLAGSLVLQSDFCSGTVLCETIILREVRYLLDTLGNCEESGNEDYSTLDARPCGCETPQHL